MSVNENQKSLGYQTLLSQLYKNRTFLPLKEEIDVNLRGCSIQFRSGEWFLYSSGKLIGRLAIYIDNGFHYLQILLPKFSKYHTELDYIKMHSSRILTSQIWAQWQLGISGMIAFQPIVQQYHWVEFLDWCQFKYLFERFDSFKESLALKFS